MKAYQTEFIEFMARAGALRFGEFMTKSGRKSPFFINTGLICTGASIQQLGRFYAHAIHDLVTGDFDNLFGPAYKGIPLVVAAAAAMHQDHNRNVSFTFNRKEAKDHGEGGSLVGHQYSSGDKVIIVEDVTTAGTSVRETVPLLQACGDVKLQALIVAVDRQERGPGGRSALSELSEEFDMQTISIVTLDDIINHLHNRDIDGTVLLNDDMLQSIQHYRAEYGA